MTSSNSSKDQLASMPHGIYKQGVLVQSTSAVETHSHNSDSNEHHSELSFDNLNMYEKNIQVSSSNVNTSSRPSLLLPAHLSNGEVVALRHKSGAFYAAAPIPSSSISPDATQHPPTKTQYEFRLLHTAPSINQQSAAIPPEECHLEVVVAEGGEWVGLRSAASGGLFLQAKRQGAHKLVFYSSKLGTWEQWRVTPERILNAKRDSNITTIDSTAAAATQCSFGSNSFIDIELSNRRRPEFKLNVDLVWIGPTSMSLVNNHKDKQQQHTEPALVATSATTSTTTHNPGQKEYYEDQVLQRVSGALLSEWLAFVDNEKEIRLAQQHHIETAEKEGAALKKWALLQLKVLQKEAEEGVEQLISAIKVKNQRLAEAKAHLETRVRWGVALLMARREVDVKRLVLAAWKARTARKKYCAKVEAKLEERAALQTKAAVMSAWEDRVMYMQARHLKLRAAVRRMALLKTYQAFAAWRAFVLQMKAEKEYADRLTEASSHYMMMWRARHALQLWRKSTQCAKQGRVLLNGVGSRINEELVRGVLGVWKCAVQVNKAAIMQLESSVTLRYRQALLSNVLVAWRRNTEDSVGEKMQVDQGRHVVTKISLSFAFTSWRQHAAVIDSRRKQAEVMYADHQRRLMMVGLCCWKEMHQLRQSQREAVRKTVLIKAEQMQWQALAYWKYYMEEKKRAVAIVTKCLNKVSIKLMSQAFTGWKAHVDEQRALENKEIRAHKRYIKVQLKRALSTWRSNAAVSAAQDAKALEMVCFIKQRQLLSTTFVALQTHAIKEQTFKEELFLAVHWSAETVQRRALTSFRIVAEKKRQLEGDLRAIAGRVEVEQARQVLAVWNSTAAQSAAENRLVKHVQQRYAQRRSAAAFVGWSKTAQHSKVCVTAKVVGLRKRYHSRLISQAYASWKVGVYTTKNTVEIAEHKGMMQKRQSLAVTFGAWQSATSSAMEGHRKVEHAQRMLKKVMMSHMFASWRDGAAKSKLAAATAMQILENHSTALVRACLVRWKAHCVHLVSRRSRAEMIADQRDFIIMADVWDLWQAMAAHKDKRRWQLALAASKMARIKCILVIKSWSTAVAAVRQAEGRAEVGGAKIRARIDKKSLGMALSAWRGMSERLKLARSAVDAVYEGKSATTLHLVMSSWSHSAKQGSMQRARIIAMFRSRQALKLRDTAMTAWTVAVGSQIRRRDVSNRAVERLCQRSMSDAFVAWRETARARRARRTVMVRFMHRWNVHRQGVALVAWKGVVEDRKAAEEELRKCLIRKKVAFRTFKGWYWETFEHDLQETLRNLFEITEAAAVDPLPSSSNTRALNSPTGDDDYDDDVDCEEDDEQRVEDLPTPGSPHDDVNGWVNGGYGLSPIQQRHLSDQINAKLAFLEANNANDGDENDGSAAAAILGNNKGKMSSIADKVEAALAEFLPSPTPAVLPPAVKRDVRGTTLGPLQSMFEQAMYGDGTAVAAAAAVAAVTTTPVATKARLINQDNNDAELYSNAETPGSDLFKKLAAQRHALNNDDGDYHYQMMMGVPDSTMGQFKAGGGGLAAGYYRRDSIGNLSTATTPPGSQASSVGAPTPGSSIAYYPSGYCGERNTNGSPMAGVSSRMYATAATPGWSVVKPNMNRDIEVGGRGMRNMRTTASTAATTPLGSGQYTSAAGGGEYKGRSLSGLVEKRRLALEDASTPGGGSVAGVRIAFSAARGEGDFVLGAHGPGSTPPPTFASSSVHINPLSMMSP